MSRPDALTIQWQECARELAEALEALTDCEHFDTGLQVTDDALRDAERALNNRLTLLYGSAS